jgi:predicted nucleic acid-binding protein
VKKPRYVLDSYALLSYLRDESMADRIEALLSEAAHGHTDLHLSTIGLGEIAYIVERRHGEVACQETLEKLATFPIQLQEATLERVLAAARLKARYAISYADAFAVALAQELESEVVTGDREFEQVESLVDVLWL